MAKRNHLCVFGSCHYEEQFCEIILRGRYRLKSFHSFFLALHGGHFVQWTRTICAILVEHSCEIIINDRSRTGGS